MRASNALAEPTANDPGNSAKSAGFSLVELLVVIAIIGLLVGLLVPGLNYAKTQAKITRTRTLLQAIESGLEMFYNDTNVGGDYPPSEWDTRDLGKTHPWGKGGGGFKAFGAQMLVWALIGPDRKGTLGFKNIDLGTVYHLKDPGPKAERVDLFFSRADDCVRGLGQLGLYVSGRGNAEVPVIADDFGMPILYFKPNRVKTDDRPLGYILTDNDAFMGRARGHLHPLWDDQYITTDADAAGIDSYFKCFIWNSKIEYSYQPYNSESYLLISAGPDRLYGTGDDITNFPLVGGKNYDGTELPD